MDSTVSAKSSKLSKLFAVEVISLPVAFTILPPDWATFFEQL
jgi:hypothetical protein